MSEPERFDVVIIGAGMGGLAAAVALASQGFSTLVLEAGPRVGGKVDVFEHEGVEMDTGPSVLTLPDVLDRVLRCAGSSLEEELTLVRVSPAFRYRFADGSLFEVHPDPDATIESARAAFGEKAAKELRRFLAYARQIWDASRDAFVFGRPPRARDLPLLFARNPLSLVRVDPFRSMADAISDKVRDPHLRDVLLRYATYNGSSPYLAPATLNCIAHVELGLGMCGVEGGMHEIARALARRAEAMGAEVRTGTPVARVLLEGGRVAGVALEDGTSVQARAVVVNADVAHLVEALLPDAARGLPKPGRASTSGLCLLVKAKRRSERVAHEVLFPAVYEREFKDLFDEEQPPRDPTLYLCAQEKAHARKGWDAHEPLFVMANAPPVSARATDARAADEDALAEELAFTVRRRLTRSGLVEEGDEVVWERMPRQLAERFPGSRGSIYGAASHGWNAAFQRPRNRIDDVPGLYLAGGTAHPGGGLPLCLTSGLTAADLLLEDLGASRAPRGEASAAR